MLLCWMLQVWETMEDFSHRLLVSLLGSLFYRHILGFISLCLKRITSITFADRQVMRALKFNFFKKGEGSEPVSEQKKGDV